ncbi:MAG: DUF6768 family protein [Balneola sp.]
MNMKKEDIDKLIEESLNKEEAEFYHGLEEESLIKQWGGLYTGKLKGWVFFSTIIQFLMVIAGFYCGYKFFTVSDSSELIRWGAGMFFAFIGSGFMKMWHFQQMDKNSILREMKRLEFQIAVLSEKLTKN